MIGIYSPNEFVRRTALQDGCVNLNKLLSLAYNFEEIKLSSTLHSEMHVKTERGKSLGKEDELECWDNCRRKQEEIN